MTHIVVTTEGSMLTNGIGGQDLNEAEAEARCKRANEDAEKLEIKTRYEVREKK